MPRKKGSKKNVGADFTINDCANAPKPITRVKKSAPCDAVTPELSWDEVPEEYDIVEEINADGTKNFVYKKKKTEVEDNIKNRPGLVYPEIVWYLISKYIKPEDVGRFARINKETYAITKRESFWTSLYAKYCQNQPRLPEKLRIENGYKQYGLRQRVIRALYHTYKVFFYRAMLQGTQESQPHLLVKRRCVNVWYTKGVKHWNIYFKLKKYNAVPRLEQSFIEELGSIDANPEEDTQVMQVICQNFYEVPPVMGMTLSSVSVVLSQGFRHHKLQLGFNSSHHVSRDIFPECSLVFDPVISIYVYDWWHPQYPYFETSLVINREEQAPMLKEDFFNSDEL